MRFALAALFAVHGVIHLMGFLKSWKLAEVPQLTGATLFPVPEPVTRLVGLLWLLCCLVCVAAALMLLVRLGPWWIVGGVATALSQLLVIYAWPDAKAGTLVNVLLVIPVVVAWADARFQNETDQQIRALFARASHVEAPIVSREALQPLPAPVRRWLEAAHGVGKAIPRSVRLAQRGQMRTSPGGAEVQATAQQYFRLDEPEFIWRVRLRMMGVLPVAGRDSYLGGHGRMLIKLASLLPVADAADEKIDQGALQRFLAEIVWFPMAALCPYIQWDPVDERTARATLTHAGVRGSALFSFDEDGRFAKLSADRYMGGGDDAKLERWEVEATDWATPDGCVVPVRGEVRWKLADGDFTFYRWELTDLDYDPPGPYETLRGPGSPVEESGGAPD